MSAVGNPVTSNTHGARTLASPTTVVTELWHRDRTLAGTAAVQTVLLGLFVVGLLVDPRTVGGEPVWLKPAKFAASLALLTGTLAWLAPSLPVAARRRRRLAGVIAVGAVVEIALIGGQAFRGVESHFNTTTTLDTAIYGAMGLFVVAVTGAVALLTVEAVRGDADTHPAFALGIQSGLVVFLVGSVEGALMSALWTSTLDASTTWLTVPVFGWVLPGDLRAAHFVGMHGLQALPVVGFLAARRAQAGQLARPRAVVWTVAVAWTLVFTAGLAAAVAPAVDLG